MCLSVCMCTVYMPGAQGGSQKMAQVPWDWSYTADLPHVGAHPGPLEEDKCSQPLIHLPCLSSGSRCLSPS